MTLAEFCSSSFHDITPGPGAYSTEVVHSIGRDSPQFTIQRRFQDKPSITSNVDYPPLEAMSTLNHHGKTIGKVRRKERIVQSSPGPSFVPNPNEFFTKGSKIKGRYKDHDVSIYPGPGYYSPKTDNRHTNTPGYGPRPQTKLADIGYSPGPCAYDTPSRFGSQSRHSSIRPRTSYNPPDEENPGFTYNSPTRTVDQIRPVYFSRAPRQDLYSNTIGSFIQNPSCLNSETPGPGYYEPSEHDRKIKTRIGQRIQSRALESTIEPNEAEFRDVSSFPKSRPVTIGSRIWPNTYSSAEDDPGPDYMPPSSNSSPLITIGKRLQNTTQPKPADRSPGPSDYNVNAYVNEEKGFTVKGPDNRCDWFPKSTDSPGPVYDTRGHNNLPMFSIGFKTLQREHLASMKVAARKAKMIQNSLENSEIYSTCNLRKKAASSLSQRPKDNVFITS